MATSRYKVALTILAVFLIAVIPAFFVTGSAVEALSFLVVCLPSIYTDIKPSVEFVFFYTNPLKIVDGRYGMSGAWIGAAPIGFMVLSRISAALLSSINNSYQVGCHV
jgi:hypothetical protein